MRHAASGIDVRGDVVDQSTRCAHYATERDIVAIRFACCGEVYPCHACHDSHAGHERSVWARAERDVAALLCGACGTTLTIAEYLVADACPRCASEFNPRCALHAHLYFET